MPWFPDFANAVELARRETRAAGHVDPVAEYFGALEHGDLDALETTWPGEVVVYDPRAGVVRGHRQLHRFVLQNQRWLAERHASCVTVAATTKDGRAVVELLAQVQGDDGREVAWPIAVVAESADDTSVVFRTYCSQWPVDGHRHPRPSILNSAANRPHGVVGRYLSLLKSADTAGIVATFAPDGYLRESIGPHLTHRGPSELQTYFTGAFGAGGGIDLRPCIVTDDGVRLAVEYNCVGWGGRDIPPQAGICVFERDAGGLLAAVRVYDDVEPPVAGQ